MKSILQDEKVCWMCKRLYNLRTVRGLEEHHVFQGRHRQLSEQYGLKVWLCVRHHRDPRDGVHFNMRYAAALKNKAKRVFYDKYGEDTFFQVFGKFMKGVRKNAECCLSDGTADGRPRIENNAERNFGVYMYDCS